MEIEPPITSSTYFHSLPEIKFASFIQSYEGDQKNGFPEGKGKAISHQGIVFEGNWSQGFPDGHGRLSFPDKKSYFEGIFYQGVATGEGVLFYLNRRYEGTWDQQGRLSKEVVVTFENGDIYKGEWNVSYPHGTGSFHYTDGKQYHGGFVWGMISHQGLGELRYFRAKYIKKVIFKNQQNSHSEIYYANGFVYEGEINTRKDTLHTNKYANSLKRLKPNGQGKFYRIRTQEEIEISKNEEKIKIEMHEGEMEEESNIEKFDRMTTNVRHDRELIFEGTFIDGQPYLGKGKYIYMKENLVLEGIWSINGTGKCKITYPCGGVYEGQVQGIRPMGKGSFTINGVKFGEGDFKYGIPMKYTGKVPQSYKELKGVFECDWNKSKGYGSFLAENGLLKYEGEINKFIPFGLGEFTFYDKNKQGEIFKGEFGSLGPINYEGRFIRSTKLFKGKWVDGECPKCEVICPSVFQYHGEVKYNKVEGVGTGINQRGIAFQGRFKSLYLKDGFAEREGILVPKTIPTPEGYIKNKSVLEGKRSSGKEVGIFRVNGRARFLGINRKEGGFLEGSKKSYSVRYVRGKC